VFDEKLVNPCAGFGFSVISRLYFTIKSLTFVAFWIKNLYIYYIIYYLYLYYLYINQNNIFYVCIIL